MSQSGLWEIQGNIHFDVFPCQTYTRLPCCSRDMDPKALALESYKTAPGLGCSEKKSVGRRERSSVPSVRKNIIGET